jgi:hypothetical protein
MLKNAEIPADSAFDDAALLGYSAKYIWYLSVYSLVNRKSFVA